MLPKRAYARLLPVSHLESRRFGCWRSLWSTPPHSANSLGKPLLHDVGIVTLCFFSGDFPGSCSAPAVALTTAAGPVRDTAGLHNLPIWPFAAEVETTKPSATWGYTGARARKQYSNSLPPGSKLPALRKATGLLSPLIHNSSKFRML